MSAPETRSRLDTTELEQREQRRVGRFSDGIDTEERLRLQRRRFSEGVEQLPDTPPKSVERRFSEGLARSPTSD